MKHLRRAYDDARIMELDLSWCGEPGEFASIQEQFAYMRGWDKQSPLICEACKRAAFESMVIPAGALKDFGR